MLRLIIIYYFFILICLIKIILYTVIYRNDPICASNGVRSLSGQGIFFQFRRPLISLLLLHFHTRFAPRPSLEIGEISISSEFANFPDVALTHSMPRVRYNAHM